ncbi:hypothetical protein ABET52_01030 [Saccharococcus caldoxylosilyticus]|jgi:hypothetical protein|uniref:Uncharacterized protein n=1 Tax=Parageobacillus caldoxylosilyticus NBRC 107762 TaxID=1220594 RepID=A0A023DCL7_9BACL|nr:hypothetical protein [Parageobacillus caldoxylosilyticus]MBB3851943.1 hypothetical protein [Parageobacillus caldoxylosilyticus]QXJ39155.1 hypothetical protein BV455_02520 [Parageobacillus caldoxylosilyticus]BDG44696.1 hypothetical protein PcaKH35_30410 [Parageobacillus caldoxylosilyticus]GAJ39045.1 hypothetical protein GCA01S_011_00980 [Parageobacillus caldoxylosilyticus NBRC 107762]
MSARFIYNMARMTGKRTSELGILSAGSFFVHIDVEFAGIYRISVERLKRMQM